MNSFFRELKQRKVYRVAFGFPLVFLLAVFGAPKGFVQTPPPAPSLSSKEPPRPTSVASARAEDTDVAIHIDHVVLDVSNLEHAVSDFEKATGVRPVFGGKHPSGTHNALVSLGRGTYVELVAPQSDAKPSQYNSGLAKLDKLTPIGWGVSAADTQLMRERLSKNGFPLTDPKAGSRVTPSGATLQWETFQLKDEFPGVPFFIVWGPQSPHPSSTSPTGCTLDRWIVGGPNLELLTRLQKVLGLSFEISKSPEEQFTLSLSCPKGKVVFGPAAPPLPPDS